MVCYWLSWTIVLSSLSLFFLWKTSRPKLWETPWVRPQPLDSIPVFHSSERSHHIFGTIHTYFREHHGRNIGGFKVKGSTDEDLMESFKRLLRDAVRSGDWALVLTPDRHFVRYVIDFHWRWYHATKAWFIGLVLLSMMKKNGSRPGKELSKIQWVLFSRPILSTMRICFALPLSKTILQFSLHLSSLTGGESS